MRQYVCAFRGCRDNYQIPVALAEAGMLDQFITDVYAKNYLKKISTLCPTKVREKIRFRCDDRIPHSRIRALLGTSALEHTRNALGFPSAKTFSMLDPVFSAEASKRAKLNRSHLLLYEPYANTAFRDSYSHSVRRILFHFHPHPSAEKLLLARDVEQFPVATESFKEEVAHYSSPTVGDRFHDCWKYADLILSASSFTRTTLIQAGADPEKCKVIPYGVTLPNIFKHQKQPNFRALFVGSGVQRKGLHHLIMAWQKAVLPKGSVLTLVCRKLNPEIESLISGVSDIELLKGVSASELSSLYQNSSVFVMPSIVEGFGQVFLESLSYGCPVLGTVNTCLPDLGSERDGIFITQVSNLDEMVACLEDFSKRLPEDLNLRERARACAAKFTWQRFRSSLITYL